MSHGLPMGNIGSAAMSFTPNRVKHQSNEYIKDAGLNWMDFNARQYDPQIGRFLSVDPLAASRGQEVYSPYAAMYNAPESTIDPNGTVGERMELPGSRFPMVTPMPFLSRSMQSFALGDMQGYLAPDPDFHSMDMAYMFDAIVAAANARHQGSDEETGASRPFIGIGNFACNLGSPGGGDGGSSSAGDPQDKNKNTSTGDPPIDYSAVEGKAMEPVDGGTFMNDAETVLETADNAAFIPATAASFVVDTKPGKYLSLGAIEYSASTTANRMAAMRNFNMASKYLKVGGKVAGVLSIASTGVSVYNDLQDGRYRSAGARAAVYGVAAGAAFIPVVGWGLSLGIGVADAIWGDQFYNWLEK